MSALSEQQIHDEILAYIQKEGSQYSSWYIGIASNPRERLFSDHQVQEENSWWIFREAFSSQSARKVEKYIIENYGTDGGFGGGDENTKYVYAYKKTNTTNP